MSVNRVILIGNLGNDPEIRQFDNGMLATVSIATSERWTDKQTGERKEHTEWHRVVFNGRLAEIVEQYLRKGSSVYVEGSLHTRKWTDQQGIERYSTEIRAQSMQMLGSRQGGQGGGSNGNSQQAPQGQQYAQQGYNKGFVHPREVGYQTDGYGNLVAMQTQVSDDEIPF